MRDDNRPAVLHLVLAGGGHSHIQVLRRLAMAPVAGLRVTLISREVHTPYSGMLPGLIAGHYAWEDVHIDLAPLCRWAGARMIEGEISGADVDARTISVVGRPPMRFDALSINCGSAPSLAGVAGAGTVGVPVKPISAFLPRFEDLLDRLRQSEGDERQLAVVGGGAGGVELALALHHRLAVIERIPDVHIRLVTAGEKLLVDHNEKVGQILDGRLRAAGIEVLRGMRIERAEPGKLHNATGTVIPAGEVLWVTQASPQHWLSESGVATDQEGFVRVDKHLRSISHPWVFAAGDNATIDGMPRPKSGVHAVRQGPTLSENLVRWATGRRLRRHRAQKSALALISTGPRHAVVSRRYLATSGTWAWFWKDWIDRRFMRRFRPPKQMTAPTPRVHASGAVPLPDDDMRCGGCGSKIGADLLARALDRLDLELPKEVDTGPGDDAALVTLSDTRQVLTLDGFSDMVEDPWLFGQIAAQHALNDIYAMGAKPSTALAWVTVPIAADALMEEDLYQVLAGATGVFEPADVALVGGHSSEGPLLAAGFALTGVPSGTQVWRKGALQIGDRLVLTKPIGTGALMAAHMRGLCQARWFSECAASMQQSNAAAVAILRKMNITACTDVTGFGLLGHVLEMVRASSLSVELWPGEVPLLAGARTIANDGTWSSLQPSNERVLAETDLGPFDGTKTDVRLLCDPQTSGGLLAAVHAGRESRALESLRRAGFDAAVVGRVMPADDTEPGIRLAEALPA